MIRQLWPINLIHDEYYEGVQFWLRLIVVVTVLLLSASLPLKASPRQAILLLGLIPVLAMLLSFLRWPALGFLALIVTNFFVPSPRLPGGLNISVLLLALLVGLWLLQMVLVQREIMLLPSRTIRPLLIFIVIALLAFAVGQLPWFTFAHHAALDAQLGGLAIFILSIGAFLLTAHQIRDLRWLQRLTWFFLALGAIYMVAQLFTPGPGRYLILLIQRGSDGSMFWTWFVALAFGQALLNRHLHPRWRIALFALVLLALYLGYFKRGYWKSGYLPPLVSLVAIVGLRSPRAGLILIMVGFIPAQYLATDAIATDNYSFGTRVDAWLIILEMIKISPLFGFGPANYYWYTRLFPIRGWEVVFNSHNQYLDIIAQTGLLGLTALIWFFAEIGWLGWRLRQRVPEGFAQAYVYGTLGGLVGTLASGMLVDWFLPFVYNIGLTGFRASMLPWLFLGGLVSLEQLVGQQTDAQPA